MHQAPQRSTGEIIQTYDQNPYIKYSPPYTPLIHFYTMMPSSQLSQVAQQLAGNQTYPTACLYLVPTPIGNLADISLRSLYILNMVDAIACEDTRKTKLLLRQYGIQQKDLFQLHQHNEHEASEALVKRLQNNQRVALVTDAGTPAISDPGARATIAVQQAGFRVMPIPGASSITTALSASGLVQGSILLYGFLPTKTKERAHVLTELVAQPYHIVLLEAPHRIVSLCQTLETLTPLRTITLARELTKQFEQIMTLPARDLLNWLTEKPERQKGEFVCIIHAPDDDTPAQPLDQYDQALSQALAYMPTKEAANLIAMLTGHSKNMLYERALQLKKTRP